MIFTSASVFLITGLKHKIQMSKIQNAPYLVPKSSPPVEAIRFVRQLADLSFGFVCLLMLVISFYEVVSNSLVATFAPCFTI